MLRRAARLARWSGPVFSLKLLSIRVDVDAAIVLSCTLRTDAENRVPDDTLPHTSLFQRSQRRLARSLFVPLMDGKGATRMKLTPAALGAVALVTLLTTTAGARADLIHWSYNWSRFPGEILPDVPNSGGKITLTDESLK